MLQRQIMFKQLQELQRRQQLQELSNSRNQNYLNQLSLSKQASGGHFPPTVNGTPLQDPSGITMIGNMQTMQHGGSNGLVLSQNEMALSHPQLDISLYGSHDPNLEKNSNQYSHLHDLSNFTVKLLPRNNSSALGMADMQPSEFGNSFMSQKCKFSSNQIGMPDGLVASYQEKDSFGKAPVEGITIQGNASLLESEERYDNVRCCGLSPGRTSNLGLSLTADSLDPLEQKILYNTDDNNWVSSFSRSSKTSTGGFEGTLELSPHMDGLPSIQSGSWSALMQSAVAETSGGVPGIQEEWSGLSFTNPEPSNGNQLLSFVGSKKLQNNWVNRNSPNSVSPSSKPDDLFQNFNMNCSFTNFQQSGYQHQNQKVKHHFEPSHATSENSRKTSQLLQSSFASPSIWPGQHKEHSSNDVRQLNLLSCSNDNQLNNNFSGCEFSGNFWLQGSTSHHVPGGIQKPYDQVNQKANESNIHGHLGEPGNVVPRECVEAVSTVLGAPLECHGQNETAPSESMLQPLNKDDTSNDQIPIIQFNSKVSTSREVPLSETSGACFAKPCKTSPLPPDVGFTFWPADPQTQSSSFVPSLLMGQSGAAYLSSHNMSGPVENQCPAPSGPSHMPTGSPVYSAAASEDNSKLEITHSSGPKLPLLGNVPVTQPSLTSDRLQHLQFQMGLPTQQPDMASKQDTSPKPDKYRSNFFRSPDPASRSLETSSAAPNEQQYQSYFQRKSEWNEQQFEKGSSLHEGSSEIDSPTSQSTNIKEKDLFRKHNLEVDAVGSGSLMINMHQQPSNRAAGRDKEVPSFPPTDFDAFSRSLCQNYSLLDQVHSRRNAEIDDGKSFPPKYDSVNKGLNSSQEGQGDQSGKALSTSYHHSFQHKGMFCQNDVLSHSSSSNEASDLAYQSHINLPMVQSWFKHHDTVNNGQILPMCDQSAAIHEAPPFWGMALGSLQENSFTMQVNLANASQGSGLRPSAADSSIACKQGAMLLSDVAYQNSAVSLPEKQKLVALEVVPWHKEVNCKESRPHDISMAELSWTQASNRRQEEAKFEAEIIEELLPVTQSKRRLICTTQLMQQVFRPSPSVILSSDAGSNCDYGAYYAAKLALGDACSLTDQLPSDSSDVPGSSDKLNTSKRTNTSELPKVVEGFIDRVKKLEDNLTRLDKSTSFVDIKVEAQELEKFSTINRFAKFHIKAHPSTVNLASSSGTTTLPKAHPQRYVVGHPMPNIVPDAIDCLSL